MTKKALYTAVATVLGISGSVCAEPRTVLSITIEDVGTSIPTSTGCDFGGASSDGKVGAFRFGSIDPCTLSGAVQWDQSGSINEGLIDATRANGVDEFTTGFQFAGAPFKPITTGSFDITIDDASNEVTVNSLPWGGWFAGTPQSGYTDGIFFPAPPDPGSVQVNWVDPIDAENYRVNFQWEHYITSTDDPTGAYVGFTQRWLLEGVASITDTGEPLVFVSIDVAGGIDRECAAAGGSTVPLSADVRLINDAELALVSWIIDGGQAGTGLTIDPFLSLGSHAVEVMAEITTGRTSSDAVAVMVEDTTPPDLDVAFIDRNTGESVISIDRPNVEHLTVRLDAFDLCDPVPVTEGIAGFPVNDGDTLKVRGKDDTVTLSTARLTVRGTAEDVAGNSTSAEETLVITE